MSGKGMLKNKFEFKFDVEILFFQCSYSGVLEQLLEHFPFVFLSSTRNVNFEVLAFFTWSLVPCFP